MASRRCVAAPDAGFRVALRHAQGSGPTATVGNRSAVIADDYPRRRLAMGRGPDVTAGATSQTLAPVLRAVLVDLVRWRSPLRVDVRLGLLAIARGGPSSPHDRTREHHDAEGRCSSLPGRYRHAHGCCGLRLLGRWWSPIARVRTGAQRVTAALGGLALPLANPWPESSLFVVLAGVPTHRRAVADRLLGASYASSTRRTESLELPGSPAHDKERP